VRWVWQIIGLLENYFPEKGVQDMESPTDNLELELKNRGYKYVIGVDEAGRGPLMGPVVAAAVYIPEGFDTMGINDSKKLSAKKRESLFTKIVDECVYAVSFVDEKIIDAINIREATKLAMRNCIEAIPKADFAIIDGNFIPELIHIPAQPVVGGDALSLSIAAASIVAKVTRDGFVKAAHEKFPVYGWAKNKGYGTKDHMEAIKKYGPCIYHRKTFGGVKEFI